MVGKKSTHNKKYEKHTSANAETLKLAVAVQLSSEGYERIVFNKIIKARNEHVRIHILAEDILGDRVAVKCILMPEQATEERLNEFTCNIMDAFGENCTIALAIPMELINVVDKARYYAHKIYMIDYEGHVWTTDTRRKVATEPSVGSLLETNKETNEVAENQAKSAVAIEKAGYIV